MMWLVLRGCWFRSVGVPTGLALDVPDVGSGRLVNELSARRDPGHGVARKRRTPEATVVVIRSAHRGLTRDLRTEGGL
jgi:hypothetical protein